MDCVAFSHNSTTFPNYNQFLVTSFPSKFCIESARGAVSTKCGLSSFLAVVARCVAVKWTQTGARPVGELIPTQIILTSGQTWCLRLDHYLSTLTKVPGRYTNV